MHLGIGGVLVAIWFVAILFGDEDTRDAAWSLAGVLLALAVLAALGLLILVKL